MIYIEPVDVERYLSFRGKAVTAGRLLNPSHPLSIIKHPSTPLQPLPPSFNSVLLFFLHFFFFSSTEEVNGETGSQALTETGRIGGERSRCTQVRGKPTPRDSPSPFCLTHPPPFASSAVSSPSENICRLSHLPIIRRSSLFVYLTFFRCTSPLHYLTVFFCFLPQRNAGFVVFGCFFFSREV